MANPVTPVSSTAQVEPFRTLAGAVEVAGVGLHSGAPITARLLPRHETGVVFVRRDLPAAPTVEAAPENVADTHHATTLQAGRATVSTVEHLLAALWARGITGCRVELDGPEVPVLDGSAQPWCELLAAAGSLDLGDARPVLKLREPVWAEAGGASVLGVPFAAGWRVSCAVDFGPGFRQTADVVLSEAAFARELAPARTFAREEWLPALRERGLIRGGSPLNALLLRDDGPSSAWRLPGELARHKALDLVGDVALLLAPTGALLQAHLIAVRAGHGLHRAWLAEAVRCGALEGT